MPKPLRSKPARKLIKTDKSPERWRNLQQRTTVLSRWEDEGGAALSGPQQDLASDAQQSRTPALTDAELVQLHKRVIALENVVIAWLARARLRAQPRARDGSLHLSEAAFTDHPLTVHAAARMNHLVERAGRFVAMPPC